VRWVSGFGRVVAKKDDNASRIVGVMYDITDRKVLEQQREEFIGIASHELKTPITSIKAYAQILQETFEQTEDKQSARLMQKLDAQVDRLTDLIRDLLDTTKIAEGQLLLKPERFNLNNLITEHVEELQRISGRHRLVWNAGSPCWVNADKERISQVLTNLISNAIKYSPNGGDVDIRCDLEEDKLKVGIRDSGIGIPEEMRQKVFDRFFRVKQQQVQTFPGMGLGLYITAGIIHRHGGDIWVESNEGQGSRFFFTLPADKTN
jgi:signal transduction histidine kinase